MDSLFPIKVWALTAVFASLLIVIGVTIVSDEEMGFGSLVAGVLNISFYGLAFNLPAFILHLSSFRLLRTRLESPRTVKMVSCIIGNAGLLLLSLFFGFFSQPFDAFSLIPLAYFFSLIIATALVKIKLTTKIKNPEVSQ